MKSRYLCFLAALFLIMSCSSDEDMSIGGGSGLLKRIEGFVDDMPIDDITEITYDDSQRIESVAFSQGNFSSRTYDVTYLANEVSRVTITAEFQNGSSPSVEVYEVDFQGNRIVLSSTTAPEKYVFTTSNGYIDTFRDHVDPSNGYFNEAHFVRDANNNIDSISYFTTNATDTNLLVWQYTFTDFEPGIAFNSAFNPVFYYSFSLYDPYLGFALGLNLSNQVPLSSSYRDGNGTYRAENVFAQIQEMEDDLLMKLGYTIQDLPNNDYHLEFEYY